MIDDCSSHEIMSTLMSLIDSGEKEHHVFIELTSGVLFTYLVDTFGNNLVNDLTGVSVYQNYPLVDEVSLRSELYLNGLNHLDALHDVLQLCLVWLLTTGLVHKNHRLHHSFKFSGHVKSCDDHVGSSLHKFSLHFLVLTWDFHVDKDV